MENLAKKRCIPCEGGELPLENRKIKQLILQVDGWELKEEDRHKQIVKDFKFKNFMESMSFVNKVADIAEREGHHPNIDIKYNRVRLTNYTHAINGLHDNDFILAAKIDELTKNV